MFTVHRLSPHAANFSAAFAALTIYHAQLANLKSPAFDDRFATSVTKRTLGGMTMNIAGVNIPQSCF